MLDLTELHQLPALEKLKIIEALWGDLAGDEGALTSPPWHAAELKKTEEAFVAGGIEVLDWRQAKQELRSRFE